MRCWALAPLYQLNIKTAPAHTYPCFQHTYLHKTIALYIQEHACTLKKNKPNWLLFLDNAMLSASDEKRKHTHKKLTFESKKERGAYNRLPLIF